MIAPCANSSLHFRTYSVLISKCAIAPLKYVFVAMVTQVWWVRCPEIAGGTALCLLGQMFSPSGVRNYVSLWFQKPQTLICDFVWNDLCPPLILMINCLKMSVFCISQLTFCVTTLKPINITVHNCEFLEYFIAHLSGFSVGGK